MEKSNPIHCPLYYIRSISGQEMPKWHLISGEVEKIIIIHSAAYDKSTIFFQSDYIVCHSHIDCCYIIIIAR